MSSLQLTLAGIVATIWVLSRMARRMPHVGWLQVFRDAFVVPGRRPRRRAAVDLSATTAAPIAIQPMEPATGFSPRLPSAIIERNRRRQGVYAGVELIILGLALPLGYSVLKTMLLFSGISTTELALVGAASVVCVGLGITAIWTSRR